MTAPGRTALSEQLGGPLPAGTKTLDDEHLADLAAALAAVRAKQAAELDVAIDRALKGVPRLLRGPARRILLG